MVIKDYYTDEEILSGLKSRDRNVVRFITREYRSMIDFLVRKMGGGSQDADDIFQEALVIIISKVDEDELVLTARFSTYLYAVSRNLWLLQLTNRKREMEQRYMYLKTGGGEDFDSRGFTDTDEKKFMHYYEQLSKVCKEIIRQYALDSSVKEISGEMKVSEKYIRRRKYECRLRLLKLIKENKDNL